MVNGSGSAMVVVSVTAWISIAVGGAILIEGDDDDDEGKRLLKMKDDTRRTDSVVRN